MAIRYVLVACGSLIAVATLLHASNSHAGPPAAHPDLQGVWVNFDSTPLEAASSDDAARLKALATWFPGIDAPGERREIRGPNPAPEFTDTNVKRSVRRRSLVVEPPNGRVPLRNDAEAERSANLARLTDSWEYHTPWERCITRGVPGGMFPAGYNNGYLILQTPEYIAIVRRKTLETVAAFGSRGSGPGQFQNLHSMAIDSKGNIYGPEVAPGRRLQKFVLKGVK